MMWAVWGYNRRDENVWLCNIEAENFLEATRKAISIFGYLNLTRIEKLNVGITD